MEKTFDDYLKASPSERRKMNMSEILGEELLAKTKEQMSLEEAAGEYEKKHTYQRYDGGGLTPEYDETLAEAFIAGAKWQKEQMMRSPLVSVGYTASEELQRINYENGRKDMREQMLKDAEECELYWDGDFLAIDLNMAALGYSERDKVKVIVLKAEEE